MHACASLFRPLSAINSIVSDGKLAAGAIEIAIYVYKPSNGFNEAVARARDVCFDGNSGLFSQ